MITVDLATGTATRRQVTGQSDTDFTAIARREDGRLVPAAQVGCLTP